MPSPKTMFPCPQPSRFDSSVFISYTVTISPDFSGVLANTAVITDPGKKAKIAALDLQEEQV